MCLLERVLGWTPERITCATGTHRLLNNPLRANARLGSACGIEYAAQAMALHGSLIAQSTHSSEELPRAGYLASVRAVNLYVTRLDDVQTDLTVRAERLLGDANNIVYSFEIEAGGRLLVDGRATVVLDAALSAQVYPKVPRSCE
jgi:predicted hotdog family 3-hydroxylacyl-ACP dehydratase